MKIHEPKNALISIVQMNRKHPLFGRGWDRKMRSSEHCLLSLGKPRDADQRSAGRTFPSLHHTHDIFLYTQAVTVSRNCP